MDANKRLAHKVITTLFDLIDIYKTVKPSHFEKLQIMQNVNKLMFQVIFTLNLWLNFDRENIGFLHPFRFGRKQIFKKFYLEFKVGDWGMSKNDTINAFLGNVNTTNWKFFRTLVGIYKSQKIQQAILETKPKEFKETVSLRLIFKDQDGKKHCLPICWF